LNPKAVPMADGGLTNDGKLELSLMHFHHTNPKWQMPKQCEVYLEKIQERGSTKSPVMCFVFLFFYSRSFLIVDFVSLVVENLPTSSILHQSLNDLQTIHGQQSFYSDPSCTFIDVI
jgi:hypothetical protein